MSTKYNLRAFAGISVIATTLILHGCGGGNDNGIIGGELENPPEPVTADYELVWSDEFDGAALDTARWDIQLGDGTSEGNPGWGNNELQYYTADNISLADGNLIIEARVGDSPDPNFQYTSARIRTQGKFDFTFGRVEARIKMPPGLGLWGAFWMLGTDPSPYGAWAAKGEIDIVESFGQDTPFAQAAAHFGMEFPLNVTTKKIRTDIDPTDGFHTYAVEWDRFQLRFFIDGEHFYTIQENTYWNYFYQDRENGFVSGPENAPFDQDHHIILNLAVGGDPAGVPNPMSSAFPGQMEVDYVRVYQCPIESVIGCAGSADPIDPFVITEGGEGTPPPQDVVITEYELYSNAPGVLFPDTLSERPLDFGVFDNSGALTLSEIALASGPEGTIIDVQTTGGGNISINDPTGETFELFGLGDPNNTRNFGGELKFDVRVISADTDLSGNLQVKMDSGFPDVGFIDIPLSSLTPDEWVPVSIRISEIIKSGIGAFGGAPINMEEVVNLIVLEPTTAAHLQFDNIKLVCGAPSTSPCGIVTTATQPQNVYIDAVEPTWDIGIGASDSGSGFADYTDGTNPTGTNKVQWIEVMDEDAERGQVIEVTFNDSSEFGVWFIQTSTPTNLAGYNDGAVLFDLKVIDYGNNTSGMTMKIDCVFPCTSGDQNLGVVADGVWETIEIPVSQLRSGGLDTTSINTGLVLFPTSQSGDITYRVDNIRWEPTTSIVVGPGPTLAFSEDFETADAGAGTLGNGWLVFANVFDDMGGFLYNYGTFDAPNGGGGFSEIASGEGDAAQGAQHLNVFSDYNNADHGNNRTIETLLFQERTITAADTGNYSFSFDAKAPVTGGIVPPSMATAFIKIIDPANGFSEVANVSIDLSGTTSGSWISESISVFIDGAAQAGQLVQFGFTTRATAFNDSGILYDNLVFGPASAAFSYSQDFEDSDPMAAVIGDGWISFASVTDGGGNPAYTYGTFDTPNNMGGFASIESGEQGMDQGLQYFNIFSDYNNGDHGNGFTIEALTFQEHTLAATDSGTFRFSFDAKAPSMNGIAAPSTAFAFIKTLDPNNGFATTNNIELDMSSVSSTDWATFSVELAIDGAALSGQILQFGFSNSATAFNPSGIYYDNISFGVAP